jgi:hypothetical protein
LRFWVDIKQQIDDFLDFDLNLLIIGLNFDAFLSRESSVFGGDGTSKTLVLAGV